MTEKRDILVPANQITIAEQNTFTNPITNVDEVWDWNNFYKYLSLNGLHNCLSFTSDIANNQSQQFLFDAYNIQSHYFSKSCN